MLVSAGCGNDDVSGGMLPLGSGIDTATSGDTTEGEVDTGDENRLDIPPESDLPPMDPEECVSQTDEAVLTPNPVDLILFVDTSGSMEDESNAVEMNVNLLLDAIVSQEMIDVRVIVVALYGAGQAMCIAAPLGPDNCAPPGPLAPIGPQLYQYSVGLGSSTLLDLIKETYSGAQDVQSPTPYGGMPPDGWHTWAREEAFKVFVIVTDTASMSTNPQDGIDFDTELLALAPEQFGTADDRNYILHAIGGFGPNTPPTEPWQPTDPLVTTVCPSGGAGQPLQQVAILTGGLRFPFCQTAGYPALFDQIGVNVAEVTPVACDFAIPEPPEGETLDPDTLEVEYLPGGAAPGEVFHQVPSEAECEDDAFWVDATSIHLCPTSCGAVQADAMARVDIRYGCDVGYEPSG